MNDYNDDFDYDTDDCLHDKEEWDEWKADDDARRCRDIELTNRTYY